MTTIGGTVELHGHRGARGLRPENTLPGFAHAVELGVDVIELDVGLSADGAVVLGHDQALSPANLADTVPAWPDDPAFPYVGTPIRELTLAQLKTVDAGVRQRDDAFARTQRPLPGTPIPTLAEACALLAPTGVGLAVELKTDPDWPDEEVALFTAAVAAVLAAAGMTDRSRLLAFDWRVLSEARRNHPALGRTALVERKTLVPGTRWLAGLPSGDPVAAARAIGATALSPEHAITTPGLVDDAHAAGLPVVVWTVNEPEDMSRFIKYGVDAIVTDYPDLMPAAARNRRPEPSRERVI
ncbi:glycerophosphodiester phosphodiesterase family protein [Actinomadura opuntiae]|uniref:glycerophosphodiester phosphodiesterase family protein n=1 Tax=Actinomadura sp. OS1-43 TaxID=604315 RepID=UPI00255A71A4|nr:glycerophosphodiester phosphodiesterase family protein [Actinomadura sp. OS1-43]MDL4813325.1 glycerophosphodiester phosphodiesterase family protein [Actinomadura sp. OS1-43]